MKASQFQKEKLIGLDINFCHRAKKLGFKVFCHTDYICSHHTRFDLKSIYYTMRQVYKDIDTLKEEKQLLQKQNDKLKIIRLLPLKSTQN